MLSLVKNKIWVLVNKPNRQKIIDYKWVYKIKDGESKDNNLMYKAQLVAKDFIRREGIDYNEIFFLWSIIRISLSLVSQYEFELE